ncbi:alpha/beta fold hydrolase [Nonomuraea wenchangensis]|uniref:alpha/beta fold hydrolase n=1 Tax=Nonomuraea wenchangensis TaxID=568860 RepID=UPI0033C05C2E
MDVLGVSYGGLIAQRLAAAAPERVRRLMPPDAFDGWTERAERLAAEAAVWADPTLSGPELTRAAAVASAGANVWRPEALADHLDRLTRIHFTAEWLRPLRAGILPAARPEDAARSPPPEPLCLKKWVT